jgi:hypothetical protein
MGLLFKLSASFVVIISAVSWAGTRWNVRGGLFYPLFESHKRFSGFAVVTGANNGLGFEIAKGLSAAGLSVILGVRNVASGEEAKRRILNEQPKAHLFVEQIDQTSFASVRHFADAARALAGDHLVAVVLNAGIWANNKPSEVNFILLVSPFLKS